jgi:predicted trehalose synthase
MRGCLSHPARKRKARELIFFFTLERAVHELSHELANRLDCAAIPLRRILDILAEANSDDRLVND